MKYKMKVVKLADIKVGERYREDLGNIEELAGSIRETGLIQPLSVSTDMVLLAGGRRYAACSALGLLEVPVLIRESADQIDAK